MVGSIRFGIGSVNVTILGSPLSILRGRYIRCDIRGTRFTMNGQEIEGTHNIEILSIQCHNLTTLIRQISWTTYFCSSLGKRIKTVDPKIRS
ncbi:hypothetical protein AMTRI_Chr03g46730 [Amborella trichopoda]